MRVWRVAHTTALTREFPSGPYCGDLPGAVRSALNPMMNAHCDDYYRHPAPYNSYSGLDRIAEHEVCGFNSLYALEAWFEPEYRALMDELGFALHVYDVPDEYARVGCVGQTVFDRTTAELISTEPLCTA